MKNLCIILALGTSSLTLYGMNVNQLTMAAPTTENQQEILQLKNDINELQTRIAQQEARLSGLSATQLLFDEGRFINDEIGVLNTELRAKQRAYDVAKATLDAAYRQHDNAFATISNQLRQIDPTGTKNPKQWDNVRKFYTERVQPLLELKNKLEDEKQDKNPTTNQ